ncbi:helix-turn-helix transcriptional regulator [Aetokthonos hydrillicola Thurmond2011]|jgi:DNA-binding Xre family transcriptional regulator|uniref:Helix-turn-helix transcriptional regulator n=1 Tax=Aetokthonos hydrillicola Thurmond2011 TaxID=2712845 RepID=A0AAP5IG84_9CYAN|nr:helix-turn-helix transcriptional regulator [Aetokthonos hydrillicola]MBO3461201.1 helix-turn-helix transcriptional regulator [Aetokthonos hydrillicola CCALA 1050]MBO3461224.1 helix-turn-helix transcriptional regulator [Aetokthonos hydrillicola CCALA 1050]MBW4589745.1 helix-turn-helix transcriptional regulator [Aetokthonos hydrillicola CCALA 1050]MBW4591047.1 helix-turn-helix transcriptional regulator [Aetokthonos hydrillicola CCALA 1050]MDR9900217.1 helix-turn-helix transcriptional regulato
MPQALIKWRLREVMARYNIKSVDLAKELNISPNAVSSLRKAKTMPRLDGNALNNLCNALNRLAEDLDEEVSPMTLIAYVRDPEPEQPQSASPVELSEQQLNGNKRTRGSHSSKGASTQVVWLMVNQEVS